MHLQSRSSWAQLTIRRVCVITTPSGRMFARSVEDHFTPACDSIDVDIVNLDLDESHFTIGRGLLADSK